MSVRSTDTTRNCLESSKFGFADSSPLNT
jgi:hypothetical protein